MLGTVSFVSPVETVLIVIAIVGTFYAARAHGRQRAGEVWERTAVGYKEEAEALRERADRLLAERDEQRALKHEALSALAAEKMKTDLSVVLDTLRMIMGTQQRQTEILDRIVGRLDRLDRADRRDTAA